MCYEALEALVVMTCEVIDGEAAKAGTHGTHAVAVYVRQVVGCVVDGREIVVHALSGPVAAYLLVPLAAESGQTTAVRRHDDITVGSHDGEVPAIAPEL